jgi:AAA15 family ATPase/GTPase
MLQLLSIKNFRLFECLSIRHFRQVNLFAGKNNTGKTFLLEALRIWAAKGDTTVVNHLLAQRGQFTPGWNESYDALFNRNSLAAQGENDDLQIEINELSIKRRKSDLYNTYCELFWADQPTKPNLNPSISPDFPKDDAIFVPFGKDAHFPLVDLWDRIVLTVAEEDVKRILEDTVLPGLIRLDINKERILVRMKNEPKPLPLQNFGDGAQRMLLLAVALVSAKDKMLLIDEVETGLHHSILELFWEKIFHYANEWNIQVFATTHSHDAVKAFTYLLERVENEGKGAFFRLQENRKTKGIEVVEYKKEDLELSLESNLEPR